MWDFIYSLLFKTNSGRECFDKVEEGYNVVYQTFQFLLHNIQTENIGKYIRLT